MTSKERVLRAIDHKETDRVPIDLGGCISSTIAVTAYDKLKEYLSIRSVTEILEQTFQIARVESSILEKLSIDTIGLYGPPPGKGDYFTPDGEYVDMWSIRYAKAAGGLYYDNLAPPLQEAEIKDIDEYPWPDPYDPATIAGLKDTAKGLADSPYAVVGSPNGFTRIFEQAWQLRGMTELLTDFYMNKEFVHALFSKILEIQKGRWDCFLAEAGQYVDVVRVGDDVAMQSGPLMSPDTYRELIKPYHKEYLAFIKERTDAKILFHCCGGVADMIDDFIEIGVDILNPVQLSAEGMDGNMLKEKYGDQLIFWGGIDTMHVLCSGSPDDVREEVRTRINELYKSGGYVLCAVHNIQSDVAPENIVTMFDEAIRYSVKN